MATVAVLAAGDTAVAREVRTRVIGSPEELVLPAWSVLVLAAVTVATVYALTPSGRARRIGWAWPCSWWSPPWWPAWSWG